MGINKFYITILFVLTIILSFVFFTSNVTSTIKYSYKQYIKRSNISYNYDAKIVKENNVNTIIFKYQDEYNKPYLLKGKIPSNTEITVLPNYAKINDIIKINNKPYKVVGYMYNPLFIYPVINMDMPLFISSKNNLVYMSSNDYNDIKGLTNDHSLDDLRLNYLNVKLDSISVYSDAIVTFIIISLSILLVIILKERLNYEQRNIYILKSLGYSKYKIGIIYLYKYLIVLLIGILIGLILNIIFKNLIINVLLNNFNLPIYKYNKYKLIIFIFPFALIGINYIYLIIKLSINNKLKVNKFIRLISKLKVNIKNKFKLLISNYKLIYVFILGLILSIILGIILNFITYLNNTYKETFKDINYKYMIKYNTYIKEDNRDYNVLFYNDNYYNDRTLICKKLNIPLSFNIKYSNNDIYNTTDIDNIEYIDSIINLDDLRDNMKKEVVNNNMIFYMFIVLLLIIFIFITTTMFKGIIDNNLRNISLLKVLGIKNNIYTVYLYILVLSNTISICIINTIFKEIDIKISNTNYLYSLLIIVFIYIGLIAIYNKKINKINYIEVLKK